jgi:hypothetical protein
VNNHLPDTCYCVKQINPYFLSKWFFLFFSHEIPGKGTFFITIEQICFVSSNYYPLLADIKNGKIFAVIHDQSQKLHPVFAPDSCGTGNCKKTGFKIIKSGKSSLCDHPQSSPSTEILPHDLCIYQPVPPIVIGCTILHNNDRSFPDYLALQIHPRDII